MGAAGENAGFADAHDPDAVIGNPGLSARSHESLGWGVETIVAEAHRTPVNPKERMSAEIQSQLEAAFRHAMYAIHDLARQKCADGNDRQIEAVEAFPHLLVDGAILCISTEVEALTL